MDTVMVLVWKLCESDGPGAGPWLPLECPSQTVLLNFL